MKKIILLIIGLLISSSYYAQNIQIKASAPGVVSVGQQFRLTYTSNEKISNINLPDIKEFTILSGPQTSSSSSVQIINGQMTQSSTYKYIYILQAEKDGDFEIFPAIIYIGNKQYQSNIVRIQVKATSGQQAPQNEGQSQSSQSQALNKNDFFIKASISKSNPYVEEQVIVHYKLYLGSQVQRYQASIRKLPSSAGFWTYDLNDQNAEPYRTKETINGKQYTVIDLYSMAVFPQKSGKLNISPLEVQTIVQVPIKQQQRSNDPWDLFFSDPFFGGGRIQNIELNLASNPITIIAKDLPGKNRPADFSALVGDFTMTSKLSRNKLATNDATNLSITISGKGNLQHIEALQINFPSDFDVPEPNIIDNIQKGPNGVYGSRTFEYVLIPRNPGDFVIPEATFSYYSTSKNQYITLQTQEISLHVIKGKGEEGQSYSSTNKKNVQILGADIRYIKTHGSNLKIQTQIFFLSPLYWLLLVLPSLLFILFLMLLRKQIENSRNVAQVKDKRASKLARKRLQKAESYLKSQNKEQFYVEISQALWGYISDKFHIPLVELSIDTARQKLQERQINSELIDDFLNVLYQCEYVRFAPNTDLTPQKMYKIAFRFITNMERELKKK